MLTTISKQFRWEMGHRLPNHSGLCKNIHGHSYEAHVILTGEPDDQGMVMDYFDISSIVRPIIDELDHCFLVDSHDTVMKDFLSAHSMKVVEIEVPTTAENIAAYLLHRIIDVLPSGHTLTNVSIRVYETEKTYAQITRGIEESRNRGIEESRNRGRGIEESRNRGRGIEDSRTRNVKK